MSSPVTSTINNCDVTIVGGGIGGIYSAWRLINSSYVPANRVCIMEQTSRVGGRQYSVKGLFPFTTSVDVGAHRFDPNVHVITTFIIQNLLKLNTSCFSKTPDCIENGNSIFNLRNRHNLTFDTSAGLPYKFLSSEKWGPGHSRSEMPDPLSDIASYLPFIENNYEDLTSQDDSIRYPAIQKVMKKMNKRLINGLHTYQQCVRSATNYSSELWSFLLDTIGESQTILYNSIYDLFRNSIFELVNDVHGEKLLVITDANGNEIGYSTSSEQLLAKIVSQGARIFYQHKLASVYRDTSNPNNMRLTFANGATTTSQTVFLNIPTTSLYQLSADSVIFTDANDTVKEAMNLFIPQPAVKMYGYYEDAWWKTKLGLDHDEGYTTNELKFFGLVDGVTKCTSPTTCKGVVLMSYPDGENTKYFETVQNDKDSPLVIVNSNTTDPVELTWMKDAHSLFVNSFKPYFRQKNIDPDTIPLPKTIVMGVWQAAWHYGPVNNFPGGQTNALSLKPVNNLKLFWVNEANSIDQGWAEGSLLMAEKAANMLGLSRPSFLGNNYWYDAMILTDL